MRLRRYFILTLAALAAFVTAFAVPASAAPQSQPVSLNFSGSSNPNVDFTISAVCDLCAPDVLFGGTTTGFGAEVETKVNQVSYATSATGSVNYDDSQLRQGQTLPLSDTLTTVPGTVTVTGSFDTKFGIFQDTGSGFEPTGTLTALSKPLNQSFPCAMPLPGDAPVTCGSGVANIPIGSVSPIPAIPFVSPGFSVDFSVNVHFDVTINGAGVVTLRTAQVTGGSDAGSNPLTFGGTSPSTVSDAVPIACTQPAGSPLQYSLTNVGYAPSTDATTTAAIHFDAVFQAPPIPDVSLFGGDLASTTTPGADLGLNLAAPDQTVTLGTIAKNNIPPTADAGGPYSGNEGSPISFDGSASSSVCGFPTLRWDFSDGGVAFGAHPQHTFSDNGVYSGLLTATDATGLVSTTTFSVDVANLPPSVNAGPDTTSDWGRPVAFNGQATDPGSGDQSTLQYSWDFGDGSPSATGGPNVLHSYASPGVNGYYDATLTVCDKDGACSSDVRRVDVTKRDTTTSYLGDTAGTFDTPATLSASLVDEYGQNVNGRSITFLVGTDGPFSALTNSSGIATKSYTPTLAAGPYVGSSSFAGDALYNPSTSSNSFNVAKKATSTQYTGAVTGGPNKTIVLSANLTDATGKPLAGRTINFQLGTQTASATTNASGVASTSLKLNQKNGTYTVSATWTPSAADAPFYLGSSQAAVFKLQAK
jgi:hypothetical protein